MENEEVTLLIDEQVFKAKKELLCEYSDYFRAMFSGNYVEKEKQEISIDVVDASSMNIILQYMKIGLIDLSEHSLSTICDLAIAANFLQITELTKQIDYCLEQQLSLSNWLEIKEIAQSASFSKLEQNAVIYGLYAFNSMKPEFIPTIHKLFWYLSHPYLNTESELHVFKFGQQWIESHDLGADALLIILCCLDISRMTSKEIKKIKKWIKVHVNSLIEKVVDCLHKLSSEFELSVESINRNKCTLCKLHTEKVYTEVLNLVTESVKRKLKLIPAVPMLSNTAVKAEATETYLYTFTEEEGFQKWLKVADKNFWGWNVASWSPVKIVVVCGEYGRGTGHFMRDVKVYDINKEEWIWHGVELPVRRHAGVVVVDDSMFVIGGVGGYRVVLDTAIIYDLKQRTFRKIAKLPDAIQSPAVCSHENMVFAAGHTNIYKYEDFGDHDRWSTVCETDMRPNCMVSFKGYIYVTQSYFASILKFKPGEDLTLERISCFLYPTVTMCSLGHRLIAFTSSGTTPSDKMAVEEYRRGTTWSSLGDKTYILWSGVELGVGVSGVIGICTVVMESPSVSPDVSAYHRRYLSIYEKV